MRKSRYIIDEFFYDRRRIINAKLTGLVGGLAIGFLLDEGIHFVIKIATHGG